MATVNTLGADVLSLRGADEEYHRISRFFRTRVEAQAALTSSDWVPTAGVVNVCVTGDEGILLYDANDTVNGMLSNLDGPARTYIDEKISVLVGDSPELLNTLSEIADAIGDDPAFFTTISSRLDDFENGFDFTGAISAPVAGNNIPFYYANQASFPDAVTSHGAVAHSHADGALFFAHGGGWVELAINTSLTSAQAQLSALQSSVGIAAGETNLGNFSGSTIDDDSTVKEALQKLETTLEAVDLDTDDMATLVGLAENVGNLGTFTGVTITDGTDIKGALQELESALETKETALDGRLDVLEADATTQTAVDGVQTDVDQNEADADAAIAAENAAMLAAVAVVQADVDQNEADADSAIAAVQADVDQNESDADAAIAAVQADVDQNEADADAAIAAENAAMVAAVAAVQADVDQNESDADAAIAAVQSDVDANEAASDAAETALSARLDTLETDPTTATAVAAVQSDVDQNEADSDAAIAVERGRIDAILSGASADTDTFAEVVALVNSVDTANDAAFAGYVTSNDAAVAAVQADVDQNESDADAAIAAVQADVDQNESDADSAIAAVQADVDQNETDADAADAALSGRLDTLEADPTTKAYVDGTTTAEATARTAADDAIDTRIDNVETEIDTARTNLYTALGQSEAAQNMGTFTGTTLSDNTTVRALLQELETSAEARLPLAGGVLTGSLVVAKSFPDLHLKANDEKRVLFSDAGGGSTAAIKHVSSTLDFFAGGIAAGNKEMSIGTDGVDVSALKIAGTAVTATATELNYVDGVTSNVQTQLDAIQADVNTNESDADTAIAAVQADVDQNESDADAAIALKADIAGPTFTGVPAAPTASAGTNSTQVATTAFVTTAVANVIDSAPGALDTLNELAAALGDDANFSTTITNAINANETHIDNAVTLTGVAKDAVNLGTFTGSTVSDSRNIKQALQELETKVEAVQTDVDGNESDADTAIALKANAADSALTGVTSMEDLDVASGKITFNTSSNVLVTSGITASTAAGGSGILTVGGAANLTAGCTVSNSALNVTGGFKIGGTAVTADAAELNYVDGVTSSIQTQLDAIQADVDGNESDADTAIAANETHIDNMATLTGVAKDATNVGTFTGSTISDNGTIKAGIQELETAVETKLSAETITLTAFQAVVAASSDFGDFQSRVAAL